MGVLSLFRIRMAVTCVGKQELHFYLFVLAFKI
jgi:hypothetical protein